MTCMIEDPLLQGLYLALLIIYVVRSVPQLVWLCKNPEPS